MAIFFIACFTDYLDGYIARTFSQVSRLGQILDPVADKLLVASVLVVLAGIGAIKDIHLVAAIIIISREILLSALREFLSESDIIIPVSKLAKYKTATQMFSIALLLLSNANHIKKAQPIGIAFLWIAAILGVITAGDYIGQIYARFNPIKK